MEISDQVHTMILIQYEFQHWHVAAVTITSSCSMNLWTFHLIDLYMSGFSTPSRGIPGRRRNGSHVTVKSYKCAVCIIAASSFRLPTQHHGHMMSLRNRTNNAWKHRLLGVWGIVIARSLHVSFLLKGFRTFNHMPWSKPVYSGAYKPWATASKIG